MPDARFALPITALVPMTEEGPALLTLTGPREGIRAIYGGRLGRYRFDTPAFLPTIEKLVIMTASRSPTPENLEVARAALEALVTSAAASTQHRGQAGDDRWYAGRVLQTGRRRRTLGRRNAVSSG